MIQSNEMREISLINLNREEICQSCEVWICVNNCRNCLINLLCGYNPRESQHDEWDLILINIINSEK
jgi:hypothetical protein